MLRRASAGFVRQRLPTLAGNTPITVQRCLVRGAASVPGPSSGGGGMQGGGGGASPDSWRTDKDKYTDLHRLPGGRQPPKDFRMGPYAHTMQKDPETGKVYPVGRFFASPKDDPVTFVVNCLIVLTFVWTVSQLSWGESFFEKRKRVIRERIRQEYGLPKGWEHEIEDDDDLQLSEAAPTDNPAAAAASAAAGK
eukprot:gb/GFBE01039910.1/.p1 GENE.gb/GFBE01039910.1/~~gb/GFBE01039910.1/.p1  ORF type:complete len:194 (+),score=31.98 gb/GFBE01039910.1/:1-582(+)